MNDDRRDVLRRLEEWKERINEIRRTSTGGSSAASLCRSLRADLKAERSRVRRVRRDPPPTTAERTWYDDTVSRAATRPATPWRAFLNEAAADFDMAIGRLKKDLAESPFGR